MLTEYLNQNVKSFIKWEDYDTENYDSNINYVNIINLINKENSNNKWKPVKKYKLNNLEKIFEGFYDNNYYYN